ncbi:MAG TPA: phosphoribosyltransferase [Holophaga sp.]|nr:phosphoribosyltransferase [Holophaga sp.]
MLHRLIYANWDDPPECMDFEESYEEVLSRIKGLLPGVLEGRDAALAAPAEMPPAYWDDCVALYLLAPALVNVALNYKVCVEQGLPLHPTYYFEIVEASRYKAKYPGHMIQHTNEFFQASIETARAIYALRPDAMERLDAFIAMLPEIISGFVYTSLKDKYTWRASNPAKIQDLADYIRKHVSPTLIVGAAHGSILSGLVLANILDVPLYFIRFSMFKRNDTEPIMAASDRAFLDGYRAGPVLLFDEDVAKGTTLTKFAETLKPLFDESYTASVLRHALSPCMPDFIGRSWHD